MRNLKDYAAACAKQIAYPFVYLASWCHSFPEVADFSEGIKPKGFRDFLGGTSVRVEYKADTPEILRRGPDSRLERR